MQKIPRYGMFEWSARAEVSNMDNPFRQVSLKALVSGPQGERRIDGFYDGDGWFRIRFMPLSCGIYTLLTRSNLPELDGKTLRFEAEAAAPGDHGPVYAEGTHFCYADGTDCFIMGTTAYVWHHRPEEIRRKSLESFSRYGFNKIRMLFFPKHYTGSFSAIDASYEPPLYPFEKRGGSFDFYRPNPEYFRQYECRLRELGERGIIADTILFHPYDFGHWNIDAPNMDEDQALYYLRYLIARVSAFENLFWSIANEYDIQMLPDRKNLKIGYEVRDWDVIGEFIKARDPAHHPISCHNIPFGRVYPDRPWMSHVSYQHPDSYTLLLELKARYNKPVIDDEYQYEGNVPDDWGNSSPELVLERHWRSVMAGGYATHGETYIRNGNFRDIFWAYGGEMTGESPRRLKFLRQIVESCPFSRMERDIVNSDGANYCMLREGTDFYLLFVRRAIPGKTIWLGDRTRPEDGPKYRAVFYDLWNCVRLRETLVPMNLPLPAEDWRAVVLQKLPDETENR